MENDDEWTRGYRAGRMVTRDAGGRPADADGPMSQEEFERRANEIIAQRGLRPQPRREVPWHEVRQDWIDGMADANRYRLGLETDGRKLHPFARQLAEISFEKWSNVVRSGLTTSDFADVLAQSYGQVLPAWRDDAGADSCVADLEVSDYKLVSAGVIDVEDPTELTDDVFDAKFAKVSASATTGQLSEYAIRLRISRTLLINDDRKIVDQMIRQATQQLSRMDARLIGDVLTANPTLGDGSALFTSANTVSNPLTITTLQQAIGMLAGQSTPSGAKPNAQPAVLLAAPDIAGNAAVLCAAIRQAIDLKLVINAWLPTATAYLMADPAKHTALTRLRMRNGGRPTVWPVSSSYRRPDGEMVSYMGIVLECRYSTAIVPTSRLPIVKIGS